MLRPLRALWAGVAGDDFDLEYLIYKGIHGVSQTPRLPGTFEHMARHADRYSATDRLRAIELMRAGVPPDFDTGARPHGPPFSPHTRYRGILYQMRRYLLIHVAVWELLSHVPVKLLGGA